jgi:hypothetical protein
MDLIRIGKPNSFGKGFDASVFASKAVVTFAKEQ